MPSRRAPAALLALVALTVLTGCSGAADAAPAPSPTPSAVPVTPYGDGVLTVATLLPRDDAARSTAEMAGVGAALRDAADAAAAGVVGAPRLRSLHRPLGAAGDGSIAAAVIDLGARGADVLLVRADAAALVEIVDAAAPLRIAVVPLDADPVLAAGSAPGLRSPAAGPQRLMAATGAGDDAVVIAVEDDLGDRAVEEMAAQERDGEGAVRIASDGVLRRAEAERVADREVDAVVVGRAASPALTASVVSLREAGVPAEAIIVVSDLPVTGDPALELDGVRGVVASSAPTAAEIARVAAEDPAVVDGTPGVLASRMTTLMLLAAAAGGDDGGLSVAQALPHVLDGTSMCGATAPCLDALAHDATVAFVPVSGSIGRYTAGVLEQTGPVR